jgi:DUF1680 family protein
MRQTTILITALLLLACRSATCGTKGVTTEDKKNPAATIAPGQVQPFPLTSVRLLDGPFRDAMLLNEHYLLSLEPDRLLHTFRINAGLPTTAKPYGGWESPNCELRGHTLGHYLSACALMYSSTGNEKLKQRTDYIVAELAKCQQALPSQGYNKGYLSAFPESFIDRVEQGKRVWAPWYTLHKIMAGLLDVYQLCGNKQALDVLVKNADWVKTRIDKLSPEQIQTMLKTEFGGMNDVLTNLYAVTGNPEHLRLAQAFDHRLIFDPLSRGQDNLNGFHANTQIPKMIGAAREYEMTGNPRYRDIALFFWERVAMHRSYVIGGCSDKEHFFPVDKFSEHLSAETAETCNTYNMLKLTRILFAWEPSTRTMDFYERGLYNHILASQDPQKGMFVYFMSLKPGHFKTYSTPENSFWCCVGTGMENHSKYGDTIYFHDDDSLWVNLFIPSELSWKEKGLTIKQETKFPESGMTTLLFKADKPVELTVKIRCPHWLSSDADFILNGRKLDIAGVAGNYAAIRRQWQDGDRLEVKLPMALHLETLPYAENIVAVLYGPIVLAGRLGTEGMPSPYAPNQTDLNKVASPEVPALVTDIKTVLSHIEPVAGKPLTFQTKGIGRPEDITLIPFYRMHHQRYSVYWQVLSKKEWEKRKLGK